MSRGVVEVEAGEAVWDQPWVRASCELCSRAWLVARDRIGSPCACGGAAIEASGGTIPMYPPEHVVPVQVDREGVKERLHARIRKSWLLDRGVSAKSLAQRAILTWWPRWQLDATAVGHYTADVGYDYEARSHVERYDGTSWTTEEKVDVRVDWQPRTGEIVQRLDNVPVPALDDEAIWRERLGDVSAHAPQDFDARLMPDGWIELPDLTPDEVWNRAHPVFRAWVGRVAQAAASGQHVRDATLTGSYEDPVWTVCLRPVWRTSYTGGDGKVRALVIDALTGEQHGMLRASWSRGVFWSAFWGILAAVAWFLTLVTLILTIIVPPLLALPILCGVVALGLTPIAFSPILTVWRWNARAAESER